MSAQPPPPFLPDQARVPRAGDGVVADLDLVGVGLRLGDALGDEAAGGEVALARVEQVDREGEPAVRVPARVVEADGVGLVVHERALRRRDGVPASCRRGGDRDLVLRASARRITGWPGRWTSSPADSRGVAQHLEAVEQEQREADVPNQLVLNLSPSSSAKVDDGVGEPLARGDEGERPLVALDQDGRARRAGRRRSP